MGRRIGICSCSTDYGCPLDSHSIETAPAPSSKSKHILQHSFLLHCRELLLAQTAAPSALQHLTPKNSLQLEGLPSPNSR